MRHGPKWDARFMTRWMQLAPGVRSRPLASKVSVGSVMAVAAEVASWSKDLGEGVGAVLVSPDGRQVSWGFNGPPRALEDDERVHDPVQRRLLSVHAELNALANCTVKPVCWHLFVTKAPCVPCALALMQFGVSRVVSPPIRDDSSWAHQQHLARSLLGEAGVSVEEWE